jgi:hypothetical protein
MERNKNIGSVRRLGLADKIFISGRLMAEMLEDTEEMDISAHNFAIFICSIAQTVY